MSGKFDDGRPGKGDDHGKTNSRVRTKTNTKTKTTSK